MSLMSKYAPSRDNMFYIEIYRKTFRIFLSQRPSPRAKIFGMWHCLVNLYKVCWNHAPGVICCPAPGVSSLTLSMYLNIYKRSCPWTTLSILIKFHRNELCSVLFKNVQKIISCETLYAMATERKKTKSTTSQEPTVELMKFHMQHSCIDLCQVYSNLVVPVSS